MSVNRIFKRKERDQGRREGIKEGIKEGLREGLREGRSEGREEGRKETANEYTEADANRQPGETLQQAVDRLRREKAKNG